MINGNEDPPLLLDCCLAVVCEAVDCVPADEESVVPVPPAVCAIESAAVEVAVCAESAVDVVCAAAVVVGVVCVAAVEEVCAA